MANVPPVQYEDLVRASEAAKRSAIGLPDPASLPDLQSKPQLFVAICDRLQALSDLASTQLDTWKAHGLNNNALLWAAANVRLADRADTNPIMDNSLRFDPTAFLAVAKSFKE
jgi:hypothetical protein